MTRDELKGRDDRKYESVTVPEWDNAVMVVRTPTSIERDRYEQDLLVTKTSFGSNGRVKKRKEVNLDNARAKLVVLLTCKAAGDATPYFEKGDEKWLADKNGAAVNRLFEVAQRLAGITDDDLDEMVGN